MIELRRGSVSRTVGHVVESAVLAPEIERLADLEGFAKDASTPDWQRIRLQRG